MTPDRIKGLIELVEGGASNEEVTSQLRKIATLQPLDLVVAGRQFVEEAIKFQEAEHDRFEQSFGTESNIPP